MTKAVLFDIDGVLVNSFAAGMRFCADILERMGRPPLTEERYREAFHMPLIPALKFLASSELNQELIRLTEIIEQINYHSELVTEPPQLHETLTKLAEKYVLGVITSRTYDGLLNRYFKLFGTDRFFSVAVTVDDCPHHKPHPGPLLMATERLKLLPEQCVYVGDSVTDVEAAKAAGMKSILFGGKTHKDADAVIGDLAELPAVIETL